MRGAVQYDLVSTTMPSDRQTHPRFSQPKGVYNGGPKHAARPRPRRAGAIDCKSSVNRGIAKRISPRAGCIGANEFSVSLQGDRFFANDTLEIPRSLSVPESTSLSLTSSEFRVK